MAWLQYFEDHTATPEDLSINNLRRRRHSKMTWQKYFEDHTATAEDLSIINLRRHNKSCSQYYKDHDHYVTKEAK
ncbi:MAG: hypothetical protein ABFC94_10260 [Syntrophomonas sp.]